MRFLSPVLFFAATLSMAAAPTSSPWFWPIKVDVKITCGTTSCTIQMKVDSGADGTTISREKAIALGLLAADGSKADPTKFGPDVRGRNANGGITVYYQTKPGTCTVEATDSFGNVCPFTGPLVMPSKGGPNVANLLGNNFLDGFCISSKKKSCKIKWEDWKVVPAPVKSAVCSVPLQASTTTSHRLRFEVTGVAAGVNVTWTLGMASTWVVIGNATARRLGLTGTQINLKAVDPDLFESLRFGGFLGNNPGVPFEVASLASYGIVDEKGALLSSATAREVLINRQSDENILSQDAIDEFPTLAESFYVMSIDKGVLDLTAPWVGTFGQTAQQSRGGPVIDVEGEPRLGNREFAVTGSKLMPNDMTFFVVGPRATTPVSLVAFGGQGMLYVTPTEVLPCPATATGNASIGMGIPNAAALLGATLSFQILDVDRSLGLKLPMGVSRGLSISVGQ